MQDAWLDSVEVDPKLAERISTVTKNDNEEQDLSSNDIGKIKRRIANALEPGETVIMLSGFSFAVLSHPLICYIFPPDIGFKFRCVILRCTFS